MTEVAFCHLMRPRSEFEVVSGIPANCSESQRF